VQTSLGVDDVLDKIGIARTRVGRLERCRRSVSTVVGSSEVPYEDGRDGGVNEWIGRVIIQRVDEV
jgi:hypothetical protein